MARRYYDDLYNTREITARPPAEDIAPQTTPQLTNAQQQTAATNPAGTANAYSGYGSYKIGADFDALYNMYKNQYTQLGQQAMQDTMGKAAGLTGGYGSSYAQNVGQQAYNNYLTQLNSIVPDLYQSVWSRARTERSDAWNMAVSLLEQGYKPSQELLAQAGLTQNEIDQILGNAAAGAAGTGSGSGGKYVHHQSAYVGQEQQEAAAEAAKAAAAGGRSYIGKSYTGGGDKDKDKDLDKTASWKMDSAYNTAYNTYADKVNSLNNQKSADLLASTIMDACDAGYLTKAEETQLLNQISMMGFH